MDKQDYKRHISKLNRELERTKNGLTRAISLAEELSGVSKFEFENFSEVENLRSIEQNAEEIHKDYYRGLVGNQLDLVEI